MWKKIQEINIRLWWQNGKPDTSSWPVTHGGYSTVIRKASFWRTLVRFISIYRLVLIIIYEWKNLVRLTITENSYKNSCSTLLRYWHIWILEVLNLFCWCRKGLFAVGQLSCSAKSVSNFSILFNPIISVFHIVITLRYNSINFPCEANKDSEVLVVLVWGQTRVYLLFLKSFRSFGVTLILFLSSRYLLISFNW